MADFISVAFQASRILGGPHRLARLLGMEPDAIYRWIAGLEIPDEQIRLELKRRIRLALVAKPDDALPARRHGDRIAA
jgi:hypothetical protein